MDSITYVGIDVHKATIAVAVADGGRLGEVRQLGVFANRAEVVRKMVERLERPGRQLRFCYEAGPCGYGLHGFLTGLPDQGGGSDQNGPARCCDIGEASPRRRTHRGLGARCRP